jgi:ParB family chromosome partitioning protein
MTDKAVCAALKSFEVDLNKHFTLGEEYLKLLTKSEIEAVAKELGLNKAMGDRFKGLAAKKKDEMIKDLLAVPDFDYAATPKALQPSL